MSNVKLTTLAAIISSIAVFLFFSSWLNPFLSGGAGFIQKLPIDRTKQPRLESSLAAWTSVDLLVYTLLSASEESMGVQ